MTRFLFAAAAAVTLFASQPAFACPDCQNCQHAKNTVAQNDKKDEKADPKVAGCGCKDSKDCKCGKDCKCPNCHAHKPAKAEEKKT
jgi:hypothetical protein